jgi:hypothetical protein
MENPFLGKSMENSPMDEI